MASRSASRDSPDQPEPPGGGLTANKVELHAQPPESPGIKPRQFDGADNRNRSRGFAGADLVADEDAGKVGGEARRLDLAEQTSRPHAEEVMQQALALRRSVHAGIECVQI